MAIPATIVGIPVKAIGEGAFKDAELTSVTIPEGVVGIGEGAFQNNKLRSVTIPGTVKTIGSGAFADNLLTEAVILEGVTTLENWPFGGDKLRSVTLPVGVSRLGAYNNKNPATVVLFNNYLVNNGGKAGVYTADMRCVQKIEENFTSYETQYRAILSRWEGYGSRLRIPAELGGAAVKAIGPNVSPNKGLESVLIPEGITYIGERAFYECKSLTSAMIPSSVTSIGKEAFVECSRLKW